LIQAQECSQGTIAAILVDTTVELLVINQRHELSKNRGLDGHNQDLLEKGFSAFYKKISFMPQSFSTKEFSGYEPDARVSKMT